MSSTRRLGAVLLAGVLFVGAALGWQAREARGADPMRINWTSAPYGPPESTLLSSGACTARAGTWVQEFGKSGITRFRWRYERRGPYDPGFLPTYGKTDWFRSSVFPNDFRNYWSYQYLRYGIMRFPAGGQYALWQVTIGERPSLLQRDVKLKWKMGTVGCDRSINFSG